MNRVLVPCLDDQRRQTNPSRTETGRTRRNVRVEARANKHCCHQSNSRCFQPLQRRSRQPRLNINRLVLLYLKVL